MKLPQGEAAVLEEDKLREYLLSESHPVGRFKAAFFRHLGYHLSNAPEFVAALRNIAAVDEVARTLDTGFGRKYVIHASLAGPSRRSAPVVTVWFIGRGAERPCLVTVYPE